MKYRHRYEITPTNPPATFDAIQLTADNIDEVVAFTGGALDARPGHFFGENIPVYTLYRDVCKEELVRIGDYIVKAKNPDILGTFYKVSQYQFERCWEPIPENKEEQSMDPNKKKAMISQPMNGLTDEQIVADHERAIKYLESQGYEIINTLFTDEWYNKDKMEERGVVQIPVCFLAKSVENMSLCHAAYFVKGWDKARGCKIEHEIATQYGLEVIEEE